MTTFRTLIIAAFTILLPATTSPARAEERRLMQPENIILVAPQVFEFSHSLGPKRTDRDVFYLVAFWGQSGHRPSDCRS
jgi:hypothetical protein